MLGLIDLGLVYCSSLVFSDFSTCNCIERFLSFTVTLTLLQYFKRELASVIRHTNVNRLQYMYSHVDLEVKRLYKNQVAEYNMRPIYSTTLFVFDLY